MSEEKKEDKGFTVVDKRHFFQQEEVPAEEEKPREIKEEQALPPVDFISFLVSLASQVYLHLGDIEDPLTEKQERNLPLAKQTIDLMGLLKDKTKGNLNPEEEKVFQGLLYDLRMRYVEEMKRSQ